MNVMLVAMVIFAGIGLSTGPGRFGRGQHVAIAFTAVMMTMLYFFVGRLL